MYAIQTAINRLYQEPIRLLSNGVIKKIEFQFNDKSAHLIAYYNYPDNLPLNKRKEHIALYAITLPKDFAAQSNEHSLVSELDKQIHLLVKEATDEWNWYYDRYSFWS